MKFEFLFGRWTIVGRHPVAIIFLQECGQNVRLRLWRCALLQLLAQLTRLPLSFERARNIHTNVP